jgi:hypothetical protein
MPAIACGTDLQVAQDRVQLLGIFFSTSEDASGAGRSQVIDANWTVVDQSPAPGTPVGEGEAVFYAVKDEEFSGCGGGTSNAVSSVDDDGGLGDVGGGSPARLAELHDQCAGGDTDACFDLFWESPTGSAEEAWAQDRLYG